MFDYFWSWECDILCPPNVVNTHKNHIPYTSRDFSNHRYIDYGILNWGICAYSLAWVLLLLLLAELKKLIVNALLWSL
jgi:hypothetical protein